jgi:hypothetical protein
MARKGLSVALVSGALVAEGSWLDVIQPQTASALWHCRFAAPLHLRQTTHSSIYSKILFPRNFGGLFRDRRDLLRDVAFVRIELLLHSGLAQLTRIG